MEASPDIPIIVPHSVHDASVSEAARFKWIESEKAGYDLGEVAIRAWVREHWSGYLRAKWVEHLQGSCFWVELDRGDFGLLKRAFHDDPELLNTILNRLKQGDENLGVIQWAITNGIECDQVVRILEALDINSRRLICQFS